MALRLLWIPSTISGDEHCSRKSTVQRCCQTKFSSFLFSTSLVSRVSDILPFTAKPRSRRRSNFVVLHISSSANQEQPLSSSTITTETGTDNETRTRLIAQNVPWTSTIEDIRNLFQKYGTVTDVELSMHDKTRNRGLAFITMGSPDEAVAALTNLDNYEFEGRVMKVNYSRSLKKKPSVKPEPVTKHNVFVGNLSQKVRSRDLTEFFSSGSCNLVTVQVIYQSNPRRPTGYGFVAFGSKEEAEAAVSVFNGKSCFCCRN
ncbi:30S ribosomal protein 2, chloroplastic isoform X2 [Macadamia integrifolia]|uniref:30S ribosomal protein 2, chloroplastic isoform X2 n=1 Tax=Macadamia integrifolia TaxID=60698 RepID=UPI001C4E423D|nr:30S ribosomal protein 2, chloroplastic isoform X2 [Macadamia integrifolia]